MFSTAEAQKKKTPKKKNPPKVPVRQKGPKKKSPKKKKDNFTAVKIEIKREKEPSA